MRLPFQNFARCLICLFLCTCVAKSMSAQTGMRPRSDRVLPAYPAEVSTCQATQPVEADNWLTIDPMTIPNVFPIQGQRIEARLVPDTPLNEFLFNHLRNISVSEPAAIRCAREMHPLNNGLYAADHVHDGSYLVWVTLSMNKTIELGGGEHLSTGSTADGMPVTVVTQSPSSEYHYVDTRNIVSQIKIVGGKASVTNPNGWMEPRN